MALSVLEHRERLGVEPGQLYIDGEWVDSANDERWEHRNPATNETITTVAIATPEEVDRAVKAARRAFDEGPWPQMRARQRKQILQKMVALLYEHALELNEVQALDNALPVTLANSYYAGAEFAADMLDHFAGWIDKMHGESYPVYDTTLEQQLFTIYEPVGVAAAIVPWNGPLLQFALKLGPALSAGCTLVLKPSELSSLSHLRAARLVTEADLLPPGVLNVVTGTGPVTGEALASHPGVDKIAFTGSRQTGKRLLELAVPELKRVTLELGGKSPAVVFDDVPDVAATAKRLMAGVSMGLSGQACTALSRALVHRSIYDEFVEAAAQQVASVSYGSPFDTATTSAPMISERQRGRVQDYIKSGVAEGARLVVGGAESPNGELANGNWVEPTLFADVDNSMTIAQEEIFGPVLGVIPFDTEEQAIETANDSKYGLVATVFTADTARAFRLARSLRAGTIGIGKSRVVPNAPFGGFKESGIGREGSRASLEAHMEKKAIAVNLEGLG